jgi:phenylacetate-CoA ligase
MSGNIIDPVDLYYRLPIFLQHVACSAYGWRERRHRYGKPFQGKLQALIDSEWWSAGRIREYQDRKIRELIAGASRHVPYYRQIMQENGWNPGDFRGREDLRRFPVLSKETVRSRAEDLRAENVAPTELLSANSSGTTGKAVHFYVSRAGLAFQWAVWWRLRRRFGIHPGAWHVNFTGRPVIPPWQTTPPYWRWNLPMKQLLVNMQQLNVSKVAEVVGLLNRFPVDFFVGYPSYLHSLALAAREAGVRLERPPRVIFTGAEGMLDEQRRDISAFTNATLTDHYGFSEACGNASRCEHGVYHEDFEFGYLECGDPEPPDAQGRVRGKILATGFACPQFPFIRYEVGDIAVWEPESFRCPCGRASRVLNRIEGRCEDYVLTPEGNRIMRFDYIFKDTLNVAEAQVVQEEPGQITVRMVVRPEYGAADEAFMRAEIARWISPQLQVRFVRTAEIEREPNGKFRAVKSLLKRSSGT